MVKKNNDSSYKVWLPLLIALFTAIGMLVGYRLAYQGMGKDFHIAKSYDEGEGNIGRIEEIVRLIEARYVDEVDQNELLDVAVDAIVNQLDPHSVYIPKEQLTELKQSMSGYYNGIGIETILYKDTLRVTKILDESPAEKSGLKFGDKIISVRDSIIAGVNMPVNKQWDFLRSKNNEIINLQVIHLNEKTEKIELNPQKIQYPNVDYFTTADGLNYINIKKFSDKTYEGLVKALESFQQNLVIDKLIIDLRNNPGGYLPEATKILNQLFVEDKRLLVYTEGREERKNEYNTTGRPFYKINKLAILINENSASASEIIAGAVQDWDKAIIVGEQSFGKGLVQEQYELDNGGAIRLTIARYFTPTGRYIQTPFKNDIILDSINYKTKVLNRPIIAQGGITPDIQVEWTESEKKLLKEFDLKQVSLAFKFILDNKFYNKSDLSFDDYDNQLNNLIMDSLKLEPEGLDSILLAAISNNLKIEIYKQIGKMDLANELFAESDIFIREAKKGINEKNIFANLQNN